MLSPFIVFPSDDRWQQCIDELKAIPPWVACDSEFFESKHLRAIAEASNRDLDDNFDPWSTQLRCLQIGLPSGLVMLIDFGPNGFDWVSPHELPKCNADVLGLDVIAEVLANRSVSKFGWALSTEALILRRHFGWLIRKPRDGMLASQVLWAGIAGKKRRWTHDGMKLQEPLSHSFKATAERVGVDLDKTEQMSDWSAEALTESQLNYAANDVHRDTLVEVWKRLFSAAHEQGVSDSIIIECDSAPAFWETEWRGCPLDETVCQKLITQYKDVGDSLRREVSEALGGVPVEGDGSQSALALGLTARLQTQGYPDAWLYRWERPGCVPDGLDRKVYAETERDCSKCKVSCRRSGDWIWCPRCSFTAEYKHGSAMTLEEAKPKKAPKPRKPRKDAPVGAMERYQASLMEWELKESIKNWRLMPMLGEKALAPYDNDPVVSAKMEAASCRSTEGKLQKRLNNTWGGHSRCRYWQIAGGFDSARGEASGAGAGMGRSSASKPLNNQNETSLPLGKKRHDELGLPNARSCVKPVAGRAMLVGDFSQAHMRFAAEVSQDPVLCDDFRAGRDAHVRLAREFFKAQYPNHPFAAESFDTWCDVYQAGKSHPNYHLVKEPRSPAKNGNYSQLNIGGSEKIRQIAETAAEPIHLPATIPINGVHRDPWEFLKEQWRLLYAILYKFQRETIHRANRYSHTFTFAEGEYGEVWSCDGKRRLYLLKEWNVPKWEDAEGRYSVKGTDAVSAVWMMSEANALKISLALCMEQFDTHPEWDAFVCNIVHDEIDVECLLEYAEPVAKCVFWCMQEGLRRAGLKSIPTCAPDDTWQKLIVKSWADK